MNEKRRCPGTRQGRCYLASNMSGFTHSKHDDPPIAFEHVARRFDKRFVDALDQVDQGPSLYFQYGFTITKQFFNYRKYWLTIIVTCSRIWFSH